MERLVQDAKLAARVLWKDKGYTLTAVLTLAICLGANGAIFGIINSVLLRPLPVVEPVRIILLYNSYPNAGVVRASNAVPDYLDRLRAVDAFEEQALFRLQGRNIGEAGRAQRVRGMFLTPSLFRLLGVEPMRGRIFRDEETEPGHEAKIILSYSLWHELYGADESVIGRDVRVDGVPFTIVGILAPGFQFGDPDVRFWAPALLTPEMKSDNARHSNNWQMIGRLRPGRAIEQVQRQIDALNKANLERFPNLREILLNAGFHTVAVPFQEDLVREVRGTLYLLWGGVLFVLLIGCVNIANLALVRSTVRLRELATRHALGAGRWRMTRQLLTETVLATLVGGLLGLLLGYWLIRVLANLDLEAIPRGSEITMDGMVAAFVIALSLIVGVGVGLVPVVNVFHANLSQVFREEGRAGTSGPGARAVRRVLVVAQVAFAFVLLVGAGLLLASFRRVLEIDPGFKTENVLTGAVTLPRARYAGDPALRTFTNGLLARIRSLPGVVAAGVTTLLPLSGDTSDSVIIAEGYQMQKGESLISPDNASVTPGYFEAMGIPLKRGRYFTDADKEGAQPVIIIDELLARKFWPNADPIGRRMYQPRSAEDSLAPGPDTIWLTVVGVVGSSKLRALVDSDARFGAYYYPYAQAAARGYGIAVRARTAPETLVAPVRREIAQLDPELPFFDVVTMDERRDRSVIGRRVPMLLAIAFASVALLLSAIGIYGVLAYQVTQRTKEIGIRVALGSDPSGIFRLVLREGLAIAVVGLAFGLTGAVLLRRALETQLYGVTALDPIVLSAVVATLATVALVACGLPAVRATRIDPVRALNEG